MSQEGLIRRAFAYKYNLLFFLYRQDIAFYVVVTALIGA
jgi:hypothetical protein